MPVCQFSNGKVAQIIPRITDTRTTLTVPHGCGTAHQSCVDTQSAPFCRKFKCGDLGQSVHISHDAAWQDSPYWLLCTWHHGVVHHSHHHWWKPQIYVNPPPFAFCTQANLDVSMVVERGNCASKCLTLWIVYIFLKVSLFRKIICNVFTNV